MRSTAWYPHQPPLVRMWVGTCGPQAGCSLWAVPVHLQQCWGWAGMAQGCLDKPIPWPQQGYKANGSTWANPQRWPCCASSAAHTCNGAAGSTQGCCHPLLPENSSFWFSSHQLWATCILVLSWQDQRVSISGQAPVASVLKNGIAGTHPRPENLPDTQTWNSWKDVFYIQSSSFGNQ